MIKLMIDNEATGFYSAAVSCASMFAFVYCAIIDSFRPDIFSKKINSDKETYESSVVRLYSVVVYLSVIQSLVLTLFAPTVIHILYGSDYGASVIPLRIITWYSSFSYYGGAKDVWILSENKQMYLIWLNLTGAIFNIVLNALLIPEFGISGASIATVITQIFVNVIMMIMIKPLRKNQLLLLKSLNPINILGLFKSNESI